MTRARCSRAERLPGPAGAALAALVALAWAPAPEARAQGTPTVALDVEYARVGATSLRLDIAVPPGPGPFPLVVWIHGGGWQEGSRSLSPDSVQVRQVARGYAVASIDYRLSREAVFPAQIHDCKGALRFLRANAGRFRIDPSRVGVWGGSAGGHLAALLGTGGDVPELEGTVGGNAGVSSRAQAVVDWFGPSDLLAFSGLPAACPPFDAGNPDAPQNLLLGCVASSCPDAARRASPVTWASPGDPPFFIVHGTADCTVPPPQSQQLHDALVAAGVPSTLTMVPGAGHGGPEFVDAARLPALEAFLDGTLGSPAAAPAWILPSAARTPGAGGTFWTTGLAAANTGTADAIVTLTFLGHDVDGRSGPETTWALAAGRSAALPDLLASAFGISEGYGAVRVVASSPSLAFLAETWTGGEGGTFGQSVPLFAPEDLVRPGAARSIVPVREDAAFRTNLVLANASETACEIDLRLVDAAGAAAGSARRVALPPLGMTQLSNVVRRLGVEGAVQNARLVVAVATEGCAVAATATAIDAVTGDPRTLLPD